jgi:hypothetical protein
LAFFWDKEQKQFCLRLTRHLDTPAPETLERSHLVNAWTRAVSRTSADSLRYSPRGGPAVGRRWSAIPVGSPAIRRITCSGRIAVVRYGSR